MRAFLSAGCVALLVCAWVAVQLRVRELPTPSRQPPTPVVEFSGNQPAVKLPGQNLIANLAAFQDEFFAYLIFGHIRNVVSRDGRNAWLTCERNGSTLRYWIRL